MLKAMFGANSKHGSDSGSRSPERAGRRFGAWKIAAAVFLVLLAVAGAAVVERKPVAAFLVQRYLARHGVASTVEFDRLSRGGFAARVHVGGEQPEFSADILDVTLSYDGLFALPTLGTVRLVRPVLRAVYDGEKVSFGSLQPLVDEALAKEPEGPGPSVTVEGGTLFVSTPDGALQFAVDGAIARGALTSLTAKLAPTQLHGRVYDADITGGTFSAKLVNGALDGAAAITLRRATLKEGVTADGQELTVSMGARGVQWRKDDAHVAFTATGGTVSARSAMLVSGDAMATGADAGVTFQKLTGTYTGASIQVSGAFDVTGHAAEVRTAAASATNASVRATFAPGDIVLGPDERSVAGLRRLIWDVATGRQKFAKGDVGIRAAHADFSGNAKITATGLEGTLEGSSAGQAVLPRETVRALVANIPVISGDAVLSDAFVRALSNLEARVARVRIGRSGDTISVSLLSDVSLSGPDNARMTISEAADRDKSRPLIAVRDGVMNGGDFSLRLRGNNLPEFDLAVRAYQANWKAPEIAWNAAAGFETKLDVAPFRGVHVKGAGDVASRNGRISFALSQCADAELAAYRGEKAMLLTDGRGRICADTNRPLIVSDKTGWEFAGRLSGVTAQLVQAQSVLADGSGKVTLAGDSSGVRTGRVDAEHAVISDTLKEPRFRAVTLDGALDLTGENWRGTLALTTKSRRFASVAVRHDMGNGRGDAAITAQDVAFDPAAFQPGDISPMLSVLASRVRGRATFNGAVAWTAEQLTSSGRVRLSNVDFQSQFGQVRQTNGELELTSLIPVTLAPHQALTMERIDWLVPLEQAKVQFSLLPTEIALDSATANVAGGRASLDPQRFAFAPQSTTQGTLRLEHVDPTPLLAAAGLSDRVKMQAQIQGMVPFTFGPAGLRFANGRVAAEGPGRLSVQREALTEAVGTGGNGPGQPAAVQDFAYQALENLAFDQLTGDVNSLPQGRLGVLLHVRGVHDPAEATETRVGVTELLQGRAFDKPLPLPKGTPIDLTLDTSLNLDELLGSYFRKSGDAATAAP